MGDETRPRANGPRIRDLIRRGWARSCPRCGEGRLFRRWNRLKDHCEVCGLKLQPRPGDVWGFWVVGDRIFIFVPLVLLYFGFKPLGLWGRMAFLAAVVVPLVWTMPHRMGVCVALDYLARVKQEDPDVLGREEGASAASVKTGTRPPER